MVYLFEDYSLDADRRELWCSSELVRVQPQVFDLLQFLVQNRDRMLSKDDLIAGVWDGRIVSDSTLSSRITAVRQAIGDSGKDQRLIRTVSRKGFRFLGEVREANKHPVKSITAPAPQTEQSALQDRATALPLPDRPSIAVLPFANMSSGPEHDYFVDGIVEDITTALSHFRQLFVIARSSSFTYKGRAVDIRDVGRQLGVRYVLEGSVRKAEGQVRITGQLIDAATGVHLWAGHFDGALENIFGVQDQVTARVIGAIVPKLEQVEIERAKRKPTESLDAYDYFLRGMAEVHKDTKAANDEALRSFGRAIEVDPEFASAYGMAALCYVARQWKHWMIDREQEVAETARLVRRAAELGRSDAVALSASGMALGLVVKDLDPAAVLIDRALLLNPNLAASWVRSAWVRLFLGDTELAIEHAARAMRLSPLDPLLVGMQTAIAFAHFLAGRYDEACSWAGEATREQPDFGPAVRVLAASSALACRMDEAGQAIARATRIAPTLCISELKAHLPFRRPEHFAKYAEGLRKAGLPE